MCLIFNFYGNNFWKLTWLDKNIFHWIVEVGLKMILSCITSCKDHELWKLSAVFVHWCYQPFTMEYYLSPTHKKITTTTFLIFNTVVLNPYSHSIAFDPYLLHPYLKSQVGVIDLSQSVTQYLIACKQVMLFCSV